MMVLELLPSSLHLNSRPVCLGRSHPLLGWSDTEETRQPIHPHCVRQWEDPMENGSIEPFRAPPVHREVQLCLATPSPNLHNEVTGGPRGRSWFWLQQIIRIGFPAKIRLATVKILQASWWRGLEAWTSLEAPGGSWRSLRPGPTIMLT